MSSANLKLPPAHCRVKVHVRRSVFPSAQFLRQTINGPRRDAYVKGILSHPKRSQAPGYESWCYSTSQQGCPPGKTDTVTSSIALLQLARGVKEQSTFLMMMARRDWIVRGPLNAESKGRVS